MLVVGAKKLPLSKAEELVQTVQTYANSRFVSEICQSSASTKAILTHHFYFLQVN